MVPEVILHTMLPVSLAVALVVVVPAVVYRLLRILLKSNYERGWRDGRRGKDQDF